MFSLVRRSNLPSTYYRRSWEPFSLFSDPTTWGDAELAHWFSPALDAKETKDAYIFALDLPGIEQKDLDISVKEGVLTISGKREREETKEDDNYCACERSYGSFSRSFTLPRSADVDSVTAELKNGVLTVSVGKKPEAQPKQITVSAS